MQGAAHLKSQLFAKGEERQVEVNQRHLIDKILARYSSEFTLFRELIQNANDAGATHIEIVLTSPTYRPPSTSPATDSASTTASSTAGAVPESSASSAASSILSIFKFGSWTAGPALEKEKEKEKNDGDGGKKKQTKRADDHALQFGSCDATEIKIQNNGRAFTEEDWTRIRKIAEGNPNSDACGMFGVGFYSVFAICEQPIIKSGDDCLIFHWRGDMLVTTRAKVEDTTEDAGVAVEEEDAERKAAVATAAEAAKRKDWVAFVLETREVMPFDLDLLSRFVVKSVSFTTNVQSISLIVNDIKLLQVHTNVDKRSTEAREKETEEVAVPRVTKDDVKRRQKEHGYMSIASIKAQRMTVKVDRYPFTKPLFVKMRLLNAQVDVHWEFYPTYLENMKRILKKTPPSRTSILLLYNFDDDDEEASDQLKALDSTTNKAKGSQYDPTASSSSSSTSTPGGGLSSFWSSLVNGGPSSSTPAQQLIDDGLGGGQARKVDDLVVDLFPCPNNGHIFIGFSTQQTTGTGFHLAAQLIPTVERENIDFQDVYISNWNCNLLAAAGQVSRLYYDHIMKKIESTRIQPEQEQILEREIVNLLSAHSFAQSHPSEKVVRLLNQYFFVHPLQYANVTPLAQQQRIPPTLFFIPSTAGILTCDKVRLPYLDMEDFLVQRGSGTTTAIVPKSLLKKCDRFFHHLKVRNMVREISLDDLLDELKRRELSLDELTQVVKWFSKPQVEYALFVNQRKNVLKLLSSLTVVVRETKEQEVIEPSGDGAPAATAAVVSFRPVRQNLGEVQFFVGASKAMRGLPLPPATLDPFISASLSAVLHKNLLLKRFGWRELTAWDWWGHIRNNLHLLTAPGGTDVLKHIAEFFPHLPEGNKNEVVAVLRQVACIPIEPRQDQAAPTAATPAAAASATTTTATTAFRRPEEVYFPSVRLFSDIDHVRADIIRHDTKPFLKALGVRDTVDLKLVLGRLEQLRWNVRDLVDYLTKQQPSFTPADWNLLRNSAFLPAVVYKRKVATASAAADDSTTPIPAAAPAEGGVMAVGAPVAQRRRAAADVFATEFDEMRDNIPRKASELFFPADEMKALGFIVLDWSPKAADQQQPQQQLDPKSKQAQLLKKIGLLDKPDLLSLVILASSYPYDGADEHSEGEQMREKILKYMEANAAELLRAQPHGFNVRDIEMRFLPARVRTAQARPPPEVGAQPQPQAEYGRLLCDPKRCFLNDSPFGFPVVEERWRGLAKKLNIAADPPLTSIIDMIVKAPPADQKSGEEVFEYLYSRLQEFTREDRRTLLATPFIPLTYGRPTVRMSATHEVFITDSFQLLRNGERRDEQRKQITARLTKTRQAIQDLETKKGAAPTSDDKLRAKLARQDPKASAAQFSQQQHYLFQLKTLQTEESKALKELKRLEAEADKELRDRAPPAVVAPASPAAAAAATAVAAAKRSAFDVFDNLLEFVDFGERGNQFLRSCGVEEYPTPEQFANNIMRHHQRYLAKNGVARYLRLLSLFAAAFPHIAPPPPTTTTATPAVSSSSALLNQLRQCPFCVALRYTDDDDDDGGSGGGGGGGKKGGKEEEEEEEEKVREETALMKKASECYLIDNERFAKLFNPPRIPHGSGDAAFSSSALEKMYESLGAKWITSDVKTSCQREGELRATPKAKKLKRLLTDRKPLLVNNMNGQRRKNLRSNAEDVLSKLQVFAVAKIERVLTFKHQRVTEEASVAVMNHENGKLALFIVEAMELDYFDIGTELVGLLYRKSVHDDALLTAMLLQTPLPTLRKRGWPVDRLLQKEDGGGAGALVYHGAVQPRELQLQPSEPPVGKGGGSGREGRQMTSAPPLSQPPKADSQPTKRPSGFFQSLWDAIAAPPAPAAPPVTPKPTTTTNAPAPLQMETTGGGRAIAAPAESSAGPPPRQVPDVQTAGGAEIVSRVKHEADDPIDAQRMYQQMESEAKRALQGVSQGASQVIHQQPGERNEVNYFCEVLPEQTLVNVDQVHGVTLYLEEGSTLSTEHVQGAQVMAQVLLQLAGVFGIPANSLHMWIGYKGRRIAFNRGNSLYFNLTVFIDLRFRTRSECMRYWYMVMCHELAHNNVSAHNEEHESLLSWLAFRHMEALNALLGSTQQRLPEVAATHT